MFEESLASLARYLESTDSNAKNKFADWLKEFQIKRLRALEGAYDSEFRTIEKIRTAQVVGKRIDLFGSDKADITQVLSNGNFLFRFEGSLRDRLAEMETEGFFDEYDSPSPAHWVEFRVIRKFWKDRYSVLISWLPRNLCEKFHDIPRLSATGELIWADDLDLPKYYPELVALARECSDRTRKLIARLQNNVV